MNIYELTKLIKEIEAQPITKINTNLLDFYKKKEKKMIIEINKTIKIKLKQLNGKTYKTYKLFK